MSACSPGAEPDVHIRDISGIFFPSLLIFFLLLWALNTAAQETGPKEFPIGGLAGVDQLPASRLRTQLTALPAPARARALQWLQSFHFTETDLPSLHADRDGGIFYVCEALPVGAAQAEVPSIAEAAVPVSPFPGSLIFHSRPGAPNVIFLNFAGENVTGTEWNTSLGRTNIPAVAFSTDADHTTFSDAEQLAIKRIWQRVAEDYAPFNVDVTTERPATFNLRTAHALITRSTDANDDGNPSSGAGGVAYVNVFAGGSYARYRPAWIYYDNLADTESYIAEAASHEIGHNLGLSHDGLNGTSYYGGHGSGDTSWGPIMGTGYNRNVSQWSKGDYYRANNTQDDLATIAGKIPYRADDHGNTAGAATALAFTGGTNVFSTTPENDPANTNTLNKGVFDHATDVDVFTFITGAGPINLSVRPWLSPSGTRGGNLDVLLELYNNAGTLISSNDPASQTSAQIQTTLAAGRYYLHVRNAGTGDPLDSSPDGYTAYGSLGQFFVSGYITSSSTTPGQLAVLPAGALTSSGTVGGPFSPSSTVYTLTNSGGSSLNWTATKAQSWVTLSSASGTLAPGASMTVTVSLNAGANGLAPGNYIDTVNFANTTTGNGNTSRQVSLTVNSVGQLAVLPAGGLTSSGTAGGPFSPSSIVYTLTNSGGSSLNWTASKAQNWASLSDVSGTLAAGASTTVTVSLSAQVDTLLPGSYTDEINFTNTTTGNDITSRPIVLTVNPTPGELIVSPLNDFSATGFEGGPFAPDLQTYSLTNAGGSDLEWTITKTANWLTLSAAQGVLAAGATTNVVVSLNENAGMLVAGSYGDVLDFVNVTTSAGNTNRLVTVTVNATPGELAVFTPTNATVTGIVGGPFSPSSATCTLTNRGGTALHWEITTTADWITLSATDGTLPPGTNTEITLTLNDTANALSPGIYTNTIAVTNVRTGTGTNFSLTLTVSPPIVSLTATVNNPDWGVVTPTNAAYPAGSTVELLASPAAYYSLAEWTGDAAGTNNPLNVSLSTNLSIVAVFRELLTTNHPTPLWWLASLGYTNDFETAASTSGANGLPLWQSYIAGLDPLDPASQVRLIAHPANAAGDILSWSTVADRLYTISSSTNLPGNFVPLPGAFDLPSSIQRFTNSVPDSSFPRFYRLEVRKP